MTKEETMKQKRDELAEKHCKSFDPPIELNGDIQNCKLDFKDGFDACYQLMEAENAELRSINEQRLASIDVLVKLEKEQDAEILALKSRIEKLKEALGFYASEGEWASAYSNDYGQNPMMLNDKDHSFQILGEESELIGGKTARAALKADEEAGE